MGGTGGGGQEVSRPGGRGVWGAAALMPLQLRTFFLSGVGVGVGYK